MWKASAVRGSLVWYYQWPGYQLLYSRPVTPLALRQQKPHSVIIIARKEPKGLFSSYKPRDKQPPAEGDEEGRGMGRTRHFLRGSFPPRRCRE